MRSPVYRGKEKVIIQPANHINTEVTRDTLFDGELICLQHKEGYRFSIDSVLLAHFITPAKGDNVLDLGTGCGIISLIMAYRWGSILHSITGIELQVPLANLARQNIAINGFQNLCRIVTGDVKTVPQHVKPESFTGVICNPPFYKKGTGRTNKNREALFARHQISGTLDDFVSASAVTVKNGGSTYFIYPAEGLPDLLFLTQKHKLEPKQIMPVYSYPDPDKSARLVLVKCIKNGGRGVEIVPPFYVYNEKNGGYSLQMKNCFR